MDFGIDARFNDENPVKILSSIKVTEEGIVI